MTVETLKPSVDADRLFPVGAAFMARTDLEQTRMLGYLPVHLDAVTSLLQGILGGMPAVRHAGGVTPEIARFLRASGLPLGEDVRSYRTLEEAEAHADRLIGEGHRLFWPYPTRAGRFADASQLVPPGLWSRLNSKEFLADITPPENLPVRKIVPLAQFEAMEFPGACYVKAGGGLATGWGFAVRHCADDASWREARQSFRTWRSDLASVIIEEDAEAKKTWCIGLGISGSEVTSLGGSEQLLASPGQQSGNLIDAAAPVPPGVLALALTVGRCAAAAGFQGLAGLDIGLARDGRLLVFDPNFRFNASTAQLLFHDAFSRRCGLPASLSFNVRIGRPAPDVIKALEAPVETGVFMPLRLFDCRLLPEPFDATLVTGLVSGTNKGNAEARAKELLSAISG